MLLVGTSEAIHALPRDVLSKAGGGTLFYTMIFHSTWKNKVDVKSTYVTFTISPSRVRIIFKVVG